MLNIEKTFDNKIKSLKVSKILTIAILLVITIVFIIMGIIDLIPKEINYTEFNKIDTPSTNVKTKVYYLMGPLLYAKNTKTEEIYEYYAASGENNEMFMLMAKSGTNLPILGKDIKEEDIPKLEGIEIYGASEGISYSLRNELINKLNTSFNENIVDNNNFIHVLGVNYFNTSPEPKNNFKNLFLISAMFAMITILYALVNKKIEKQIDNTVQNLKEKGTLEDIIKDYESGQLIEYKKVKVEISPKYIFSYTNGLDIIAFKDIKEVYATKKIKGNANRYKYIVIETKNDETYYIAPQMKRNQKIIFNELLAKIKTKL